MTDMTVSYEPVDSLHGYDGNAKQHDDEQIDAICASISEFGFSQPLICWHDGDRAVVMLGNGRLEAARRLGIEKVPVLFRDDLTDEKRRMLALADNQTTLMTGWDSELLSDELDALSDAIDLSAYDFEVDSGMATLDELDGVDDLDGLDSVCNKSFTVVIGYSTDEGLAFVNGRLGIDVSKKKTFNVGELMQ